MGDYNLGSEELPDDPSAAVEETIADICLAICGGYEVYPGSVMLEMATKSGAAVHALGAFVRAYQENPLLGHHRN